LFYLIPGCHPILSNDCRQVRHLFRPADRNETAVAHFRPLAFATAPFSCTYAPVAMKPIPLVEGRGEGAYWYFQGTRGTNETTCADEPPSSTIQDTRSVGRHLQQPEQMKTLIPRAVEVIKSAWINQKPIFVRPSRTGELLSRFFHRGLQTSVRFVRGIVGIQCGQNALAGQQLITLLPRLRNRVLERQDTGLRW
jgi:hypothetical protein